MKTMREICAVAVATACFAMPTVTAAKSRAILIGINDYAAPSVNDLNGTHNDVATMRALLINDYGFKSDDVLVLLDAKATHQKIVNAIRQHLIASSAPGDIAVFYYSGHGSQMRDKSGDETDGLDETIVAQDSRLPSVFDISDDELNQLLAELATKTPNITVVLDSCHSGTAARGLSTPRRTPADMRDPPEVAGARQTSGDGPSDILSLGANFTLISGSRANELSNEDLIDDKVQGALTYSLSQTLRTNSGSTYRTVFPEIAARVSARFPSQNPQLEGTGLDASIFGLGAGAGPRYVSVEPAGNGRAKVLAGAMYGLARGAELQVYGPDTGAAESPAAIAKLVLTEVDADVAVGELSGLDSVPGGSRSLVSQMPIGARKKVVWLADDLAAPFRQGLASEIAAYPSLELVIGAAAEQSANLRVIRQDDRIVILGRDGTALSDSVVIGSDLVVARVSKQLQDWARWLSLLELSNPFASLSLKVSVRITDTAVGSPAPTVVSDGTLVTVRIENTSATDLYFALLDLSSSGRIALLFPAVGAQDQLKAGRAIERAYRMSVPQGRGALTDIFKVVASDTPIDGSIFAQAAVRDAPSADLNDVQRFLADRATARSREATAVVTKDWTTAQASVLVTRSAPVLDDLSFAVHFRAPTTIGAVERSLAGQRSLCRDPTVGNDCARATPLLTDDDTVYEVRSPALTGQRGTGSAAYKSVGQAFDEAYVLRDSVGAEYAEPLLKVTMPEDVAIGAPGTRGGESEPDPIASGDAIWSLRYANVPRAFELVRATTNRPAGKEAQGILVAHPDTGYSHHPENWEGANPRAVDVAHGYDYVDDDNDPKDPLSHEGLIANPGHGTASSSVIVSPPGCQLPGVTNCVTGAGPGARIIPLRVHTSVVVFDTKRLSRAIAEAAAGKLGVRVDVISIAMGGPPSIALWKAVRRAEKSGLLVIAAAGNYVQMVVWPARFDATIAVSAVNPRCTPWRHASHGSAVDISAPGDGVWRATFDEQNDYTIGMGAGTTFATGTTAGVATLWLAQFNADPQLAILRNSGQLTRALREALAASSWRPENSADKRPPGVSCDGAPRWQPLEYGAGIVNARALLERPLSQSLSRAVEIDDAASRIPQWTSLYDSGRGATEIESDYESLFAPMPIEKSSAFETEILYHYTMNEEVRTAVDRVIVGSGTQPDVAAVKNALRGQDLSQQLRAALQ